jgi:predicted DNA-binding antitoxin AbrB/MazE fold protein
LSKVIRARYEKGSLRPLESVNLREGEEVQIVIRPYGSVTERFYGIAKKRRPGLSREEFMEVLEEIEDESFRGL